MSGTDRYEHVKAHLCKGCGSSFQEGHDVVCLSDGYIEIGEEYEVRNRRFFHAECWINSDYMDTGSDRADNETRGNDD